MRVHVYPLASTLHGEGFIEKINSQYRSVLQGFEGVVYHDGPVTKPVEIPTDVDLVVLIHLTGGTSRLAFTIARGLHDRGSAAPILLVAHSRHNSLASALSARIRLLGAGYKTYLLYSDERNDFLRRFTAFYQGVRAGYGLGELRILDVNEKGELSLRARLFMDRTGGLVEPISYEDVWRIGEEAGDNELGDLVRHVGEYVDLSGVVMEDLYRVMRIYYALRRLVAEKGYTGIVIDCFPFLMKYGVTPCLPVAMMNMDGIPTACEGDYHSLVMLYLSMVLTGRPGWIANPSGITSYGYLRFAHCTMAPTLGRECWLTTHFESGRHYAVVCMYKYKRVLFGRLNESMDSINLYRGVVRESGFIEPGYCRNQLIIDTGPLSPREFVEDAWGNHHVFMPWREDLLDMLKSFAWWMGWSLTINN